MNANNSPALSLISVNSQGSNSLITNFLSEHVRVYLDKILYDNNQEILQTEKDIDKLKLIVPALDSNILEGFGVCVMADVSGYSKLTAIMSDRGKEGVELLTKTMKQYLDRASLIVNIIIQHGGDIVKFAGDAVLFYWKLNISGKAIKLAIQSNCTSSNNSNSGCSCINCLQGDIVLKAALCCSDLLKQLGRFEVNIEGCDVKHLSIHLGIGAGEVFDVHAKGNDGRFEHFVAGDAINQLMDVLNDAKPAQLALSNAAWFFLTKIVDSAKFDIKDRNMNCVIVEGLERVKTKKRPTIVSPADMTSVYSRLLPFEYRQELYEKYITKPVIHKLKAGFDNLMSLTDIRQVTTVFIKLGGFQMLERSRLNLVLDAFKLINEIVERLEGVVRQLNIDDKGAVLLLLFGLPPLSHQNDAVYGVTAAIEISKSLKEFNKGEEFSIGVSTGLVAIGGVGNFYRTEYALMGDSINMAARLMCLPEARESVLTDERTYTLCIEHAITFDTGKLVKVKGKQEKIKVYKPLKSLHQGKIKKASLVKTQQIANDLSMNRLDSGQKKVTLIGRERESELIREAMEKHLLSSPTCLIIEGDAGSGMSTLNQHLMNEASDMGFIRCSASASEINKRTPLYVFQDLLFDIITVIHNLRISKLHEGRSQIVPNSDMSKSGFWLPVTDSTILNSISEENTDLPKEDFTEEEEDKYSKSERNTSKRNRNSKSFKEQHLGSLSFTKPDLRSQGYLGTGQSAVFSSNVISNTLQEGHLSKLSLQKLRMMSSIGESLQKITRSKTNNIRDKSTRFQTQVVPSKDVSTSEYLKDSNAILEKELGVDESRNFDDAEVTIKDKNDESLDGRIRSMLRHLGENPNLAPLFGLIFPVEFNETPDSSAIQGRLKLRELTDIMKRILSMIASNAATMLIIEEAQWLDYLSWQLLGEIFANCKDVMICIFIRNPKQYDVDVDLSIFESMKKNIRTTYFKLENIKIDHMEELLIYSLRSFQKNPDFATLLPDEVLSISQDIIETVFERSGGSPLYAKSIIRSIVESGLTTCENGILRWKDAAKVETNFMPVSDLQSLIISQFDKLDPDFQQFLKVASVIGEQFLVEDVMFLLPTILHASILNENFFSKDKYEFLAKEENQDVVMYTFKSSLIRKGIYSLMHKEQREQLHLELAKHYESFLDNMNRIRLLIPVYDHYKSSGCTEKALFYLAQVCHFYFETGSADEAIKHYLILIEATIVKKLNSSERTSLASWYRELGEAYSWKMEFKFARRYIIKAMKYLGYKFPSGMFSFSFHAALSYFLYKKQLKTIQFAFIDDAKHSMLRECFISLCNIFLALDDSDKYRFCLVTGCLLSRSKGIDQITAKFEALAALETSTSNIERIFPVLISCEDLIHSIRHPDMNICADISTAMIRAFIQKGNYLCAWRKVFVVLQYAELCENYSVWLEAALLRLWLETLSGVFQSDTGNICFIASIRANDYLDPSIVSYGNSILAFFISLVPNDSEILLGESAVTKSMNSDEFVQELVNDMLNLKLNDDSYQKMHSVRKFSHEVALFCLLFSFVSKGKDLKIVESEEFNTCELVRCWTIYITEVKRHHWDVLFPLVRVCALIYKIQEYLRFKSPKADKFKNTFLPNNTNLDLLRAFKAFLSEAVKTVRKNFFGFQQGRFLAVFLRSMEIECTEFIKYYSSKQEVNISKEESNRLVKPYWKSTWLHSSLKSLPFFQLILDSKITITTEGSKIFI